MIARRRAQGDGSLEAQRILECRLSDVVYRALKATPLTNFTSPHDSNLAEAQAAAFAAALLQFHVKHLAS